MRQQRTNAAFSLIEMIVVIGIMMSVMAMLLPGLTVMQKKSDAGSTVNIIRALHDTQARYARQFGSAGLIYGYTIRYTDSTVPGTQVAAAIKPWIISASGFHYNQSPDWMLKADLGSQPFWDAATTTMIEFQDGVRPGGQVVLGGTPTALVNSNTRYLHIGLLPRTGALVTPGLNTDADPNPATYFDMATVTSPAAAPPGGLRIDLWNTRSAKKVIACFISDTGVMDVRASN